MGKRFLGMDELNLEVVSAIDLIATIVFDIVSLNIRSITPILFRAVSSKYLKNIEKIIMTKWWVSSKMILSCFNDINEIFYHSLLTSRFIKPLNDGDVSTSTAERSPKSMNLAVIAYPLKLLDCRPSNRIMNKITTTNAYSVMKQ